MPSRAFLLPLLVLIGKRFTIHLLLPSRPFHSDGTAFPPLFPRVPAPLRNQKILTYWHTRPELLFLGSPVRDMIIILTWKHIEVIPTPGLQSYHINSSRIHWLASPLPLAGISEVLFTSEGKPWEETGNGKWRATSGTLGPPEKDTYHCRGLGSHLWVQPPCCWERKSIILSPLLVGYSPVKGNFIEDGGGGFGEWADTSL